MPRFVVLTHDHPILHWDFMLEWEGVLKTWRLAQPPDAGAPIEAERVADHRLAYLDFEGPIGGGRGHVTRWDAGDYEDLDATSTRYRFRLSGARLRGPAQLTRS